MNTRTERGEIVGVFEHVVPTRLTEAVNAPGRSELGFGFCVCRLRLCCFLTFDNYSVIYQNVGAQWSTASFVPRGCPMVSPLSAFHISGVR